nr:putative truncated transposase [Streptomyces ambofaciens ATCC 23877]CAI78229.1 putative truncated transposase [Streptomyces ambofaciens ATCC 23877]CAJ87736.1 hypothetical protein SAMT0027 [Streptomyces ambofaciens ATCC 23877]CAJ89014.1 hypothetical protein SAMT0027 [Streptomyces ambofaciens ATCC 23877]
MLPRWMSHARSWTTSPSAGRASRPDRHSDGSRALGPFRQAVLVLRWFRERGCVHYLARTPALTVRQQNTMTSHIAAAPSAIASPANRARLPVLFSR